MAGAPEASIDDESVLLDAYWASYGDASTRALLRSQPEDTSILEVVIGADDRQEITITTQYPWRAICSLLMTAGDGSRWIGTGWLVGPRTLVTAGHCVYMHQHGGWVSQIEVIPGRRGAERPFGSVMATAFRSVRGWTEKRDRAYDYGAILLPEGQRIGDDLGWFGFAVRGDEGLTAAWVNISGYPGDKPTGTQWFHAKEIADIDERVLTYVIDTAGGQSGAPVWIKLSDGSRYGVGIHTNGAVTGNSATRICQPVFDNIKAWRMAAP
jgi:V8-like Glu-specific endopeptidase